MYLIMLNEKYVDDVLSSSEPSVVSPVSIDGFDLHFDGHTL